MAIDTDSKKASAMSSGLVCLALVVPGATVDEGDRQTIASIYSGIIADELIIINNPSVKLLGKVFFDSLTGKKLAVSATPKRTYTS